METQKAAPYKVDQERPVRQFEVMPDGDVKMIETQKSTVWFKSREFTSFVREHEAALKDTLEATTEERLTLLREQADKIKDDIATIDPFRVESEAKAREHFEKTKLDAMVNAVRTQLNAKKPSKEYFSMAYKNSPATYEKVMAALTDEERIKVTKLRLKH